MNFFFRNKEKLKWTWKANLSTRIGWATKVSKCWASNLKWRTRRFPWPPQPSSWCSFTLVYTSDIAMTMVRRSAWIDQFQMVLYNIKNGCRVGSCRDETIYSWWNTSVYVWCRLSRRNLMFRWTEEREEKTLIRINNTRNGHYIIF